MLFVLLVRLFVCLFLHKFASNMPGKNWAPTLYWQDRPEPGIKKKVDKINNRMNWNEWASNLKSLWKMCIFVNVTNIDLCK